MKRNFLFPLVLLFLLTGFAVYGSESLLVDVPFSFQAGAKNLQPGKYELVYESKVSDVLTLRSADGKEVVDVPIITRLAARVSPTKKEQALVFDDLGSKKVLSEIWLPTMDGFLVSAAKEHHTHKILSQ